MITEEDLRYPPDRPDRHPYEIAPMVILPIVSLIYMTNHMGSGHVDAPGICTAITIIVGCALTLAGALLPRERDIRFSLRMGALGQFAVACGLTYLTYWLITGPIDRPFLSGLTLSIAVAAVWRIWQMIKKLRAINVYVEAHRGSDNQSNQ